MQLLAIALFISGIISIAVGIGVATKYEHDRMVAAQLRQQERMHKLAEELAHKAPEKAPEPIKSDKPCGSCAPKKTAEKRPIRAANPHQHIIDERQRREWDFPL